MNSDKLFLLVVLSLFVVFSIFTGVTAAQSDSNYYYEYGKYSDEDTDYAERKTVYDWLRGSYSLEIETDNSEEGESPEESTAPDGTPESTEENTDEDSDGSADENTDSDVSSSTATNTTEIATDGNTETEEIDPFADYAYPGVESYNIDGVYGLFSGGYFYPEAIQSKERIQENRSEEEVEESFESVETRLRRGQYYKFDDRVYQNPPREATQWNLYNGSEYRSYGNRIDTIPIPEEDIGSDRVKDVSFPAAGSIETQTNYKDEEVEIPRDPFVNNIYLGVHSISNTQYVHEYRKENSVYDKTTRLIGARGSVSTVIGIDSDPVGGVFTGVEEGDKFYGYFIWGESLEDANVNLTQETGSPSYDCLEDGCDVTSGEYGEGWSVGYGRTGYNIPDKYTTPNEKFKFKLEGNIKINIERYTYVREKTGTECTEWKYDTDEVEPDENECLEEEKELTWSYVPDSNKVYEISNPISTESETFEFQGGFNYNKRSGIDRESDSGDDVKIHRGVLPDDEYVYQVKPDINGDREIWKSIQGSNNSFVYSGWHHFTSRNKGWDRMFEPDYTEQDEFKWPWETEEDSGIHTSRIRPINVHTYQHSSPHTNLSSGSDAFEVRNYERAPYKDKNQALLDYHSSCWIEQPEDEDNIDEKTPKELRQCNWTHTAQGVGFTDKNSESKQFYTGEYRKDAYVEHKRTTSVLFHSNKPYDGFVINGLTEGTYRYDTVDTSRDVRDITTNTKEINSVDNLPVDTCSAGSLDNNDCVVNPENTGYDVYEIELQEELSETTITTEKNGIDRIVIEDGLSASDVSESVESETVDSTAILGSNDKHYLSVNTQATPQVVKLNVETVDWTELETDSQAYLSTNTNVQAEGDPNTDSPLRTGLRIAVAVWVFLEIVNRAFTVIGFSNPNIGKLLYGKFMPTQGMRFIMLIAFFIVVLDYFFGGFF